MLCSAATSACLLSLALVQIGLATKCGTDTYNLYQGGKFCVKFRWLGQFQLGHSACWQLVQRTSGCDLTGNLFMYSDGTASAERNCGCAIANDCLTNHGAQQATNIYQTSIGYETLHQCQGPESWIEEKLFTHKASCEGVFEHKVTLVWDFKRNTENDMRLKALGVNGAKQACSASKSCCIEVSTAKDVQAKSNEMCGMFYPAFASNLTIGVGESHAKGTIAVADCNLAHKFAAVDVGFAFSTRQNVQGIAFSDFESGYLVGVTAGLVAKTGKHKKVGVVSGPSTPPVKRYVTGFTNAVAEYCPACQSTEVINCPDVVDNANCGVNAARELLAGGVDVVFGAGGFSGTAAILYAALPVGTVINDVRYMIGVQKAENSQAYVIGTDVDEYTTTFQNGARPGAEKILTSALKKMDVAVKFAIGNYMTGNAGGKNFRMNVENGGIGYAPCHEACAARGGPVTEDTQKQVENAMKRMAAGSFDTRVNENGECTAAPGPGCPLGPPAPASPAPASPAPSPQGHPEELPTEEGVPVVVIIVACALSAICCCITIFLCRRSGYMKFDDSNGFGATTYGNQS